MQPARTKRSNKILIVHYNEKSDFIVGYNEIIIPDSLHNTFFNKTTGKIMQKNWGCTG